MKRIRKIVITGGPCAGKSTVLCALREEFGDRVVLVPEAATVLLEGGFPVPGRDLEWSEEWQAAFQPAVLALQSALERSRTLLAGEREGVLVCDRGILDGAAYTEGGVGAFCRLYEIDEAGAHERYEMVIHLESLATSHPERYGTKGNASRYEPLPRAQELEHGIRDAWRNHPKRIIIGGERGMEGKIAEVTAIVREMLANG
jgi:predicted ATPase